MLRAVTAIRYVTPMREGGSLPGLMEADDLGTYVVKFRGAGQGRAVLVAEVVAGELARGLGLPVPELVVVDLDPALGASEPDQEVQELLRASPGANLGMDFLPGALDLDPTAFPVDAGFAGRVLWFDALVGNVDRSWRNANLLFWHGGPYLIDHGATLTFHHAWSSADAWVRRPYDAGAHVLLGCAPDLAAADAALAPLVTEELLAGVVAAVPDGWLADEPGFAGPDDVRAAYVRRLLARRDARGDWLPGVAAAVVGGQDRTVPATRPPAWIAQRLGRRA
ncbi:HipA family kinase [Pseudonocardia humida]|uniref:HipA family kinase n=1 Tax=Pseudonocardia humida TaxID=2800819 RepID=UPI00207C11D7|nr:HipA family kinase [Pseudonocardia humida]